MFKKTAQLARDGFPNEGDDFLTVEQINSVDKQRYSDFPPPQRFATGGHQHAQVHLWH